MIQWAIILFVITATGGAILASQRLLKRPLSLPLALVHGTLAVVSVCLLALGVLLQPVTTLTTVALVLFLFVALGGLLAFSYHMRKQLLPLWLLAGHAGAAIGTLLLLIYSVYGTTVGA